MYIIILSAIVLIIIFYGNILITMIKSVLNTDLTKGIIWFIGIFIINISLLLFILGFYYYQSNKEGNTGKSGDSGFPGEEGQNGFVNIPCYRNQ